MNSVEETNKSLERIELTLKSIDYQLTRLANLISSQKGKVDSPLSEASTRDPAVIPEMITIKEASKRTGLSYDYLRKECIRGNITHLLIGNGKRLINYDRLLEQLESSHGSIQKTEERG